MPAMIYAQIVRDYQIPVHSTHGTVQNFAQHFIYILIVSVQVFDVKRRIREMPRDKTGIEQTQPRIVAQHDHRPVIRRKLSYQIIVLDEIRVKVGARVDERRQRARSERLYALHGRRRWIGNKPKQPCFARLIFD